MPFSSAPSDRRRFLFALAGLVGAGAIARAQKASTKPYRIDIHHHLFPPAYSSAIVAQGQAPSPAWTPARSIEEMDKSGIALAVVSLSAPNVIFPDAQLNRRLAREVNEYGAKMVRDYPGRFGLFAVLPLADADASLSELEYALDTLKAQGIGLMTSYGDKWLGHASFAPVWAELNRRKSLVYTHPHSPDCCANLNVGIPATDIEWATDTTRTIASLLLSGTAARSPDIRWIFAWRRRHAIPAKPIPIRREDRQAGAGAVAHRPAVRIEEVLLRHRAGKPSWSAGRLVAAGPGLADGVRRRFPVPRRRRGDRRFGRAQVCGERPPRHRARQRAAA